MTASRPVGVVTGIASEARVVRGLTEEAGFSQTMIACAGASPRRALEQARGFLRDGAGALVSFGIAGGLDPDLRPGHLVMADAVFTPVHHLLPCNPAWRKKLRQAAEARNIALHPGHLAGSHDVVPTPEAKVVLARLSGGRAVDMESHSVALAAWEAGVPFLTIRAIADSAGSVLPRAARGSLDAAGHPRVGLVFARLCLRPWELGELQRLRADAKAAHKALWSLKPLASVLFGGP